MKAPYAASRPVKMQVSSPLDMALGYQQIAQTIQELKDLKDAHEAAHRATLAKIEKDHAAVLSTLEGHVQRMYDYVGTLKPEKAAPPVHGKDAEPVDERALEQRIISRIRVPKDGETPVVNLDLVAKKAAKLIKITLPEAPIIEPIDHAKLAAAMVTKIKEEKLLTPDHIDGLKTEMASYRNQLAGKHYGSDTMVRGGGDTVAAGSNVTITTVNGVKTIAATGGTLTELTATGTIDSSNTTFTFTSKPTYLFIDGVKYRENEGWTWSVLTATVTKAPDYSIWGEK